MAACQYKYKSDYPEDIEFACSEPSITTSKFCIFHDKDHYAMYEEQATERFEEKVLESISQEKPLECFGYYLPKINFEKLLKVKSFGQPVYFNEAIFHKGANFSYITFSETAIFIGARFSGKSNFSASAFSKGANFSAATFSENVNFIGANFYRGAFFIGAKFSKQVSFWDATFSGATAFTSAKFSKQVSFWDATFSENVNFIGAIFSGDKSGFKGAVFFKRANFDFAKFPKGANFSLAEFLAEVRFVDNAFDDKTFFNNTSFEKQSDVRFDNNNLSNVSFAYSDITRIRFGDKITWGGKDGFAIIEEEWLKARAQKKTEVDDTASLGEKDVSLEITFSLEPEKTEVDDTASLGENLPKELEYIEGGVSLELVLSVYRNLRENYEFRLRYDEAGKFFIKEMELKRKYRETHSEKGHEVKENGWFRRHFTLTGLYYHLSWYGESISRPAAIGAITVLLSTLFWITQSNPTLEPHFAPTPETISTSTFVGLREFGNGTQWLKGFERSLAGFLPFLSAGGETQVGIIDYIIKIFGGGLTFVLLAIALRRKFERKYTR